MLRLVKDNYEVVLLNDPAYTVNSTDNTRSYDTEFMLAERQSHASSQHGITVESPGSMAQSCIILAEGGATGIHEHSAILHGGRYIVAVGRYMCSLRLPLLELEWSTPVDTATCFGVYRSLKHACYISHGELEIARVSYSGEIVWSASGKDIFTGHFTLLEDFIEVVDFNDEKYRVELADGRCELIEST
jgi:hypothetical protein